MLMGIALAVACGTLLGILTPLALYQWVLAAVAMTARRRPAARTTGARSRFVVLVPAYNEESGIGTTLRSLDRCDYPRAAREIVVVADRCTDGTAKRARACGAQCFERETGDAGKGPAIAWAIDQLAARGIGFDAIVIVDADTIVDRGVLAAFDERLRAGHEVQQAYNYLSNPWDTPFTRIISVTSVLRNGLFYVGKERLGLPAMLTGCGMCFSRRIIDRHRWTAFSVGEDWEFSASLLLAGEEIHFNEAARVRAAESRTFRQASSQRLRWASGRHGVAGASATRLVAEAVRRSRPALIDAALTIVAPTYSTQATLALLAAVASWLAFGGGVLVWWAAGVTALLAAYFAAGLVLTDAPMRAAAGIALIPAFLPWRMAIEILGLLGYGRKRWVRTSRVLVVALAASLAAARADAQPSTATGRGGCGVPLGWSRPGDFSPQRPHLYSETKEPR